VSAKTIVWKNLIAQDHVKELLGSAFSGGSLGHAYLFCGDEGVGKFAAALDLALSLLCEASETVPCLSCSACRRVLRNNHPDFHGILPVSLEKEHKSSDGTLSKAGWDFLSSTIVSKITSPYQALSYSGAPTIPVDWTKEVNHAVLRGAVSGDRTVAVICGIDLMNKESANAMLKTLEEPPANTFLVLTTDRPEAVLPTIASRCQIIRFGHIPVLDIRREIARTLGSGADEGMINQAVHYSMGSLGRALLLAGKDLEESSRQAKEVWNLCYGSDKLAVAAKVDELAKQNDFDMNTRFFSAALYLVRNSFLSKSGCPANYIDGSDILDDPGDIFARPDAGERLTRACNDAIAGIAAYGNVAIILVNFVMTVMETIHGEKQQAG
jgi:DNA polymerase III delta prime subunit